MDASQIRVLIAEDESIIALDIKRMVEKLGYHAVAIVNSYSEAIKEIELEKPNLILMDIQINGEKNGIETAEIIYSKYSIPFIYLTALTDSETLQRAKKTEPFGYVVKPFDENSLRTAIEMALYKFKVESELKKKSQELEQEKIINDNLLKSILPEQVISEMKSRGIVSPRLFNSISILFCKFGITEEASEDIPPDVLLNELNDIFVHIDKITNKHELEKVKSSGDMYMICGGIPLETHDHAERIVLAALDIHYYLSQRNKYAEFKWTMKAGINSGQAVAGILNAKKCTYDVWGEAVNIASRMESSSEAGRINISRSTFELVKDDFEVEYRGKITAKGKGKLDMYYVTGLKKKLFMNFNPGIAV